jgi:hypothetical protein
LLMEADFLANYNSIDKKNFKDYMDVQNESFVSEAY